MAVAPSPRACLEPSVLAADSVPALPIRKRKQKCVDLHRARHGWLLAGGQLSAEHVWQRTRHGSIRMRATPDLADTCLRLALADRSHRGPHASRKAPLVGGNQSVRHGPRAKMFWLSAEWGLI